MPTTGFRDYTAGDQPTADEFDGYIGAQVIGIYADAATRDTEITILTKGMRAVTLDDGIEWLLADETGPDWVEYGRWKEWGTYTPTLDATTTPPTMGTGPTQVGRYSRQGTDVDVAIYIAFGSSGSAPGTGIYEVSLPPSCPASAEWYGAQEFIVGNGIAIDATDGTRKSVAVTIVDAGTVRLEADGLTGPVTESNLIAWGDADVVLSCVITYETEEVS